MWKILADGRQWIVILAAFVAAAAIAVVFHFVVVRILAVWAKRNVSRVGNLLIRYLRGPLLWLLVIVALYLASEPLKIPAGPNRLTQHLFSILLIFVVAWLLIRAAYVLSEILMLRYQMGVADNLHARVVATQINVLRRLVVAAIVVVALAVALTTFQRVRQLGTAMLASAGVAGIVLGFAAQKTLGNLIAGLQIAFTQPLRIDDVVIVEGEWGRIEEITLTYVVVRIWDLRRLIVPITYFVEHPFENWTRISADILGTVFLYVDYTVPIEAVRAELTRILESTDKWDRKVNVLQVTNATDRTVELRALMSARDSGTAWDLRCLVRERLIEFVRTNYPDALPRLRAQFERTQSPHPNEA